MKLLLRILILIFLISRSASLFSQEEIITDTSDFLPLYFTDALENNLMVAAANGYDAAVEKLIERGAKIDGKSSDGATPLIFAVANNHLNTVKLLLSHNPDLDVVTKNNETPLIIAVRNENSKIIETLIRGGADVNKGNNDGVTPLHYAALNGSFEVADMLLYYDADCNVKSDDGTTPLMAAIFSGYADVSDLLIQNGANLESRDKDGFTPFLIAAQKGDTVMMNFLIKEGIDLYEKNLFNYNALTMAIESNNKVTAELLLQKGNKWSASDNNGINPYRVASSFGRKEIIDLLEKNKIAGENKGLKIDEISVSASIKANVRDYFTGAAISFKEPLLNAGFILGCDLKPVYTRVLLKTGENSYYQYFDKTSIVYAGFFKDFLVSENPSGVKVSLTAALAGGYTFSSKFRGTNTIPESKFKILPEAGLKIEKNHFTFISDLQYMNSGFYKTGSVWLRVGFAFNTFLSTVRSPVKTIKWN